MQCKIVGVNLLKIGVERDQYAKTRINFEIPDPFSKSSHTVTLHKKDRWIPNLKPRVLRRLRRPFSYMLPRSPTLHLLRPKIPTFSSTAAQLPDLFANFKMSSLSCALMTAVSLPKFSRNGVGSSFGRNPCRSRVSMAVSVGSREAVAGDELFKDYKPSCAFLFPGQVIGAVV